MKFVLLTFIIWRLGLFAITYFASQFLPFKASFPYSETLLIPSGLPDFVWSFGNFDGVHYLTIAGRGYDGFGAQVFFPLFPVLVGLLTKITSNALISGLVVSNISAYLAAIFLFKFVKKEFTEKVAKWTIVFLFCFPTSFFLGSIYPESLLLLLILLAFQTKGFWAGIFAGLASGTKLIGVFLSPLLVLIKPRNLWGIIGVSGIVIYMFHLWQRFNQPLMFLSAQKAFENNRASDITNLVLPPQVIFRYTKIFLSANWQHFDSWVAVLELISFIFGFVILILITRKKLVPLKIIIFSWIALLLPAFSGTFSSMPRYLLPIFPIFVYLATIKNIWFKGIFLITSCLLLVILSIFFSRGYFIS